MKLTTNRKANFEDRHELAMTANDNILAAEEKLVPSSGFAAAVMERVREEAAAPAPIPFPWKRMAPGLVLAAGVMGWGGWEAARFLGPAMHEFAQYPPQIPAIVLLHLEEAGWVALALAASWGGWALSMRMVRRQGY
jgi:hypothetical protein